MGVERISAGLHSEAAKHRPEPGAPLDRIHPVGEPAPVLLNPSTIGQQLTHAHNLARMINERAEKRDARIEKLKKDQRLRPAVIEADIAAEHASADADMAELYSKVEDIGGSLLAQRPRYTRNMMMLRAVDPATTAEWSPRLRNFGLPRVLDTAHFAASTGNLALAGLVIEDLDRRANAVDARARRMIMDVLDAIPVPEVESVAAMLDDTEILLRSVRSRKGGRTPTPVERIAIGLLKQRQEKNAGGQS